MKIIQSTYQPFLTLDYIVNESENKLFDRKSSRIKPSDLAPVFDSFDMMEQRRELARILILLETII